MNRREQFIDDILNKNPNYDTELITKAYRLADDMHKDQIRKSGEPYIIHPIAVAKILADLGMDDETIVAGLLHDVVEDTDLTLEDVRRDFGESIALLVDGVTKLGSIVYESKEKRQAETLRKMFLAMSKDIRVLIIKLSDRLHNLRTINYMTEEKIKEKCTESLEIYAPLASRLGMNNMKTEMEDICLKYLDPEAYYDLAEKVSQRKGDRQKIIDAVIEDVREALDEYNFKYEIMGRSKHFYSIYRKMKYQNKQLDEIFDLSAIRIIVETVRECYAVLGVVHTMWKPIPGKFKDYIAMPKPNMYQSLHTTVIGDNGSPFEIQIRTVEMHRIAEYGIAAHWKYKEGIKSDKEEVKLSWLRQTLELQKEQESNEFMETLKVDLFASQVYVFTPKGDVMELPAGSTPLDFAFKIHTDVGCKCVGAKINGKIVPIDYILQNGDIVDILTNPNSSGPNIDWLKIAKSSTARTKIRQYLKKVNKGDNVEKGKEALDRYIRKKGYSVNDVLISSYIQKASKELKYSTPDDMYAQISQGGPVLGKAANLIIGLYREDKKKEEEKDKNDISNIISETKVKARHRKNNSNLGISVKGMSDLLVRVSKCCNPVPGDEIIGYITKGRGVSVHRADCPNITGLSETEKQRFIEVEWDEPEQGVISYDADISIIAEDRKGLFSDLSKTCEDMDVHIVGVNFRSNRDGIVHIIMTLALSNTGEIEMIIRKIRNINGVIEAGRAS
ncbi:MAG: bifunctional (p)ppGpp synthetase/guanosine-3',5'-bis(diphosphate) 3'-pyrophosphohydrolase [Anaerovoracaceae bacterium]|nr:bifunctional (p)ppGpp synthetase/guanosine-3',5'-bis(diphosphate) 3'-pyrophosphohydrolase [Anaerovoracaceae bacterium]